MTHLLRMIEAEVRREFRHAQAYYIDVLADQALFTVGFLLLAGIFQLVAEGQYDARARLVSLVGFLTWRVADGFMLRMTASLTDDAQWGTLEQLWLNAAAPQVVFFARSVAVLSYHSVRAILMAVILIPILGLSPVYSWGAVLLFLVTQISAIGLTFVVTGLSLVYKNVASITLGLSTVLLFLTGALAPIDNVPWLYSLARLLPLTIGIQLLREMLVDGIPLANLLRQADLYWLLVNSTTYGLVGWIAMEWAQQTTRRHGSLAHY